MVAADAHNGRRLSVAITRPCTNLEADETETLTDQANPITAMAIVLVVTVRTTLRFAQAMSAMFAFPRPTRLTLMGLRLGGRRATIEDQRVDQAVGSTSVDATILAVKAVGALRPHLTSDRSCSRHAKRLLNSSLA